MPARSTWLEHPNYPEHTLLLESHDNFRRVSSHLVRESMTHWSQSPQGSPAQQSLSLFKRWKSAMKRHEHYEESKLYPVLTARFGVSMAVLELHHRQLALAEDHVLAAFREGDTLKAAHALKKHDEILVPHLEQEEDIVIPMLLSLSRKEFVHYGNSSTATLLAELA